MPGPLPNAKLAGGKYELIEEIGRGGMGTVWRAHSVLLDRPCAIKFLKPEIAEQSLNRERFVNEARVAARLRSPYTVTIFDVDYLDGVPFIAMELLPGESLERRLTRGPLSPRLVCQLVRQVASGLGNAHAAGLVHRDLKPDNIFVVEDQPLLIKILDFGVAKNMHASAGFHTVTGAIIGTPHYMSPEQAMGKPIDGRCDLWALGVVTYRCFSGRFPFQGETWPEVLLKIVNGDLPPLTNPDGSSNRALDRWWKRVMRRDPDGRPATAEAFANGLEEALLGGKADRTENRYPSDSVIRMRSDRFDLAPTNRPRSTLLWGLAALLVLGTAVGVMYWTGSPRPDATVAPHASDPQHAFPVVQTATDPVRTPPTAQVASAVTHSLPKGSDVPREEVVQAQVVDDAKTNPARGADAVRSAGPPKLDDPPATGLGSPTRNPQIRRWPQSSPEATRPPPRSHPVRRPPRASASPLTPDAEDDPLATPTRPATSEPPAPTPRRSGFDTNLGF